MKVIIIGFQYDTTLKVNKLPGTSVDIYRIYRFCERITNNISVITDIVKEIDVVNVMRPIVDGIVDAKILTFIDEIKSKKQYKNIGFKSTLIDFQNLLSEVMTGEHDKVIVYYTGHGIDESILLPDTTLVPIYIFRDNIVERSKKHSQILWIMDCCYPSSLQLPFKLVEHYYQFNTDGKREKYHPTHDIITFSSSDEKSISTRQGSIFSKHLFNLLEKSITYLPNIKDKLSESLQLEQKYTKCTQTVGIYASHPDIWFIWSWIIPKKVSLDLINHTLDIDTSSRKNVE